MDGFSLSNNCLKYFLIENFEYFSKITSPELIYKNYQDFLALSYSNIDINYV